MSWLYSQALVEEYSAGTFLDGAPCALWNGTHTQRASWLPAKMTDACRLSRSGMMFKPLTDDHGEAVLTWFREAFPARTSAVQEKEPALTESEAVCGDTWHELSVKFDPGTSSWKTAQCLWDEDLPESLVTLPRWGMMRDGALWERTMPEHLTSGTGSGLWPTPQAHKTTQSGEIVNADGTPWDGLSKPHSKTTGSPITTALADAVKMWPTPCARDHFPPHKPEYIEAKRKQGHGMSNLNDAVAHPHMFPTPKARDWKDTGTVPPSRVADPGKDTLGQHVARTEPGGSLNPTWVEWLMGWPLGWTDCAHSATDRFRQWSDSHGKF